MKNEVLKISPLLTKTTIVIGSLLLIIVAYLFLRTTPEKYYAKAARQHKCGEKRYCAGNHEAAERSYQKAEELRKKARELE